MHFNSLKEKCEYFRSLTDYKLLPNSYVIAMLDGRSFSRLIKNKYKLPFDAKFMGYMNMVAKYLCENVQGAKFAYVQSDEISLLITDFDTPQTDSPFGYRLCKLQSLLASMATGKFNQLVAVDLIRENLCKERDVPFEDVSDDVAEMKLAEFDCKVWNVPDANTAYCHFLWRQNDCIRNSKQQAAQTYLSHKDLLNKNADQQIELLLSEKGIDWNNDYSNEEKYGRILRKIEQELYNDCTDETYKRKKWIVEYAKPFPDDYSKIMDAIINLQ